MMVKEVKKCVCGYEMIERDGHLICEKYFEDIKKMMLIIKEKMEVEQ